MKNVIQVKFIRLRDAPLYLGMDRRLFNQIVRPKLAPIPIGKQGIAFDRVDLDAWAEQYKAECNVPLVCSQITRNNLWDAKRTKTQ